MSRFTNGWFRVERRVFYEDLMQQGTNYVFLWLRLLSMANLEETNIAFRGQRIVIKPGEILTSKYELSSPGLPKSTVHRILAYLENSDRIRTKRGPRGTIITICNWDRYQNDFKSADQSRTKSELQSDFSRTRIEQYNNITNNSDSNFKNVDKSVAQEANKLYYQRNKPFDGDITTLTNKRADELGITYAHLKELTSSWWTYRD